MEVLGEWDVAVVVLEPAIGDGSIGVAPAGGGRVEGTTRSRWDPPRPRTDVLGDRGSPAGPVPGDRLAPMAAAVVVLPAAAPAVFAEEETG